VNPSLKNLLIPRSHWNYWLQVTALCLTWFFASVALMQPKGHGRYLDEANLAFSKEIPQKTSILVRKKMHEVIFLLDVSSSMSVKDTRTGKSRLDDAKEIVDAVISQLKGESASLFAFTSTATPLVPATMDYIYLRMILRQVQINEGGIAGTDFLKSLSLMHNDVFVKNPKTPKTLIILSDGDDTLLEDLQASQRKNLISSIVDTVKNPNLQVLSIGLGSKEGENIPDLLFEGREVHSFLNDELLEALSANQGRYYEANVYTPLLLSNDLIYQIQKNKFGSEEVDLQKQSIRPSQEPMIYDEYFQIPLGIAILALWTGLSLPEVRKKKVSSSLGGLK
jgi:Ca-activated chloride channel family protein